MSTQEEKKLDDFIRNMVMDAGLEKPGPDLKEHIMQGIRKQYSRVTYRSLIPKKVWILLAIFVLAFVALALYNPLGIKGMAIDLFPWDLDGWFGETSKITVSAVVILGFMMCIQVLLLKRRLDRSYTE